MNTKCKGKNLIATGIALIVALTLFFVPMTAFAADTTTKVTVENVKEIALTTVGGGTVTKCEMENKDGRSVYDITVIHGDKKYEMNINASTAKLTNYTINTIDQSGNSTTFSSSSLSTSTQSSTSEIISSKAQSIALARVGGGIVTKCKTDYEHRRLVYEVEIRYNGWEYEIDIDAATGEVVKYETDD